MAGDELAIKQLAAPPAQRRNQPGQRHFRRIVGPAEHRFAAEHPVKPDAVKPADQCAIPPAFDRMGMAELVQQAVGRLDPVADPGPLRIGARPGALRDDAVERLIAGDGVSPAPQHFGERARTVEGVQRQHRAAARLNPEHLAIIAPIGHREHPAAIGQQQQVWIQRRRSGWCMHSVYSMHPVQLLVIRHAWL